MSTNNSKAPKDDRISLADEEGVKQVLVNSVLGLWDVVNNLTRLRPSKHDRYRVTIFGSARAKPESFVYDEVKRLSASLAEMGCDIITGGGPGLMQAANEGAAEAPERNRSVGIRVELPFEQEVNPFVRRRSSTRPSSRGCIISFSPPMLSSWRRAESVRYWRR